MSADANTKMAKRKASQCVCVCVQASANICENKSQYDATHPIWYSVEFHYFAPYRPSTCFIDLSSRCVHDDDVEIIKQIDVKTVLYEALYNATSKKAAEIFINNFWIRLTNVTCWLDGTVSKYGDIAQIKKKQMIQLLGGKFFPK